MTAKSVHLTNLSDLDNNKEILPKEKTHDLGSCNKLLVYLRLITTSAGGTWYLVQGATPDPQDMLLTSISVPLTTTTQQFLTIDNFLRYVSWKFDDTGYTGGARLVVEIIGKE